MAGLCLGWFWPENLDKLLNFGHKCVFMFKARMGRQEDKSDHAICKIFHIREPALPSIRGKDTDLGNNHRSR